jgi:hypothetical protein
MTVIAYTYEAAYHCIACTKARFNRGGFSIVDHGNGTALDEHGVSHGATDREGNQVHPVHSTDELPCHIPPEAGGYSPVSCDDCRGTISEAA